MSKKALVIVGLAAVIAASTGIAYATNHDSLQKAKSFSDTAASSVLGDNDSSVTDGEVSSFSDSGSGDNAPDGKTAVDPSQPRSQSTENSSSDDDSAGGPTAAAECIASYALQRVVLRENGEEQSPRVLFGKFASACYLKLYDDGTAEICLNPSAGTSERGAFSVENDKMYVDLGADRTAEYQLFFADGGGIDMVAVPYGEYDIYFS